MAKKFKYTDHPSITIVSKKPRLRIFEDFCVEEELPKFKVIVKNHDKKGSIPLGLEGDSDSADESRDLYELKRVIEGIGMHTSTRESARWDRDRYIRNKLNELRLNDKRKSGKTSIMQRLRECFSTKSIKFEDLKEHVSSVEETFEKIKDSFIIPTTDMLEKHKRILDVVIERLKSAGQYQKMNEIEKDAFVLAYEMTLAKDGRFSKYLTEDQVIQFMLKSEKGVNVEFLRFYHELLPTEVINLKIEADKLNIFDNYAVIHYDTTIEKFNQIVSQEDERRERERRRDPILVGMIQGCRKLFYISDWVTPEDDLTIDKLEEVIGVKAKRLKNIEDHQAAMDEDKKKTDEMVAIIDRLHSQIQDANDSVTINPDL